MVEKVKFFPFSIRDMIHFFELKYAFLISSALTIYLAGIFWVFLINRTH